MKTITATALLLAAISLPASALTGIPEPGVIFYGKVTNNGGTAALPISSLSWTISEPGTGRMVQLELGSGVETTVRDGETWYIARLGFATTSVSGFSFDPLPDGTFPLSAAPVSYTRSVVTVNGSPAALSAPAAGTFPFPESGANPAHSRLERVDLSLSISNQALYDAWISTWFAEGDPRRLPEADPDNDGIRNLMERALGLNPNAPSVVPVSSGTTEILGQKYFTYTFRQPSNIPDAPLVPEISENLQTWESGNAFVTELQRTADGDALLITVRDVLPMNPTRKAFIRLRTTAARP